MKGKLVVLLVLVVIAVVFSYLNSGERATLNLGIAVLYRIPLTAVVFGAFLLGMLAMFLFTLRHDMRVRRAMRNQRLSQTMSETWNDLSPP